MAQKINITEIVQSGDFILFYTATPDMEKVGKLNTVLDGRVELNFKGKVNGISPIASQASTES